MRVCFFSVWCLVCGLSLYLPHVIHSYLKCLVIPCELFIFCCELHEFFGSLDSELFHVDFVWDLRWEVPRIFCTMCRVVFGKCHCFLCLWVPVGLYIRICYGSFGVLWDPLYFIGVQGSRTCTCTIPMSTLALKKCGCIAMGSRISFGSLGSWFVCVRDLLCAKNKGCGVWWKGEAKNKGCGVCGRANTRVLCERKRERSQRTVYGHSRDTFWFWLAYRRCPKKYWGL